LFISIFTSSIFGGGFQINEHSARAMAMGGAFTGLANDASAIYFNAAGLTQLNGTHFLFGTTLIAPSSSWTSGGPEFKTDDQLFFPTHIFVSHRATDNIALGIGFTTPFGLGTKWDANWPGRYDAIQTDLKVFTISPVVALKVSDQLSLSAGLVYSWANVTITQKAPIPNAFGGGDALVTLEGKDNSAFGFNLGLFYKPSSEVSFGLSFHSQLKYNFEGTATTSGLPSPALAPAYPNGPITADLTAPFNLTGGIAYQISPKVKLLADVQFVGWSSFDTLKIVYTTSGASTPTPRMYDNSFIVRLGTEIEATEKLSLGAGMYFDKSPVKEDYVDPQLPEGNRLGFTLGLGYKINENVTVNASYLFIYNNQVNVTTSKISPPFNGTYNSHAHLASIGLSIGI
jgi:long-chain fatty acid transport protein